MEDNVAKVLNRLLKEGALSWLKFDASLLKALENFLQVAQVFLESLLCSIGVCMTVVAVK